MVPDFNRGSLAIGTPIVLLARKPADIRAINQGLPVVPHAGREFSSSDRLIIRVPVTNSTAAVTARLLNGRGAVLTTLHVRRLRAADNAFGEGGEIDLPLSALARGDYMIMFEAAHAHDRVDTFMALRVGR